MLNGEIMAGCPNISSLPESRDKMVRYIFRHELYFARSPVTLQSLFNRRPLVLTF